MTDPCFASHGVDGSRCSFQQFLSDHIEVVLQKELDPLKEKLLQKSPIKYKWIMERISSLWPSWVDTVVSMGRAKPFNHTVKKVLLSLGFISDSFGFGFAEKAYEGGPLGELVQWSDLIASLYILGHDLEFYNERLDLLKAFQNTGNYCDSTLVPFDLIYTDIVGFKLIQDTIEESCFNNLKCIFRILDIFGTEPVYNYKDWKPHHQFKDMGKTWGNLQLNPRQFMTYFPHTPDNSLLGFVMNVNLASVNPTEKENIGVVYGKNLHQWEGKQEYLNIISKYIQLHATVSSEGPHEEIPHNIINHGVLHQKELFHLLSRAKVFIGLGSPLEGPAPLEAIAFGCIFINPKIIPPISKANSPSFANKPTDREITLQNEFAEQFIGKPWVFTIDISDHKAIEQTMMEISKLPPQVPYLPGDFTMEGMLERLLVYHEHQSFCKGSEARAQWPPKSELIIHVSDLGQDCRITCQNKGLICEPELFPVINKEEVIKSLGFGDCVHIATISHHAPSYNRANGVCTVNTVPLLMGCAGKNESVIRICPCRDYRKGQVALCKTCTR